MDMQLIVAVIGLASVAMAALLSMLGRRRRQRADAERNDIRHLVGSRQWWKTPPGDGPEGDH